MNWFEIDMANKMAKERIERGARNAQFEAHLSGYAVRPSRHFKPVAAFIKWFQARRSPSAVLPKIRNRRRPA